MQTLDPYNHFTSTTEKRNRRVMFKDVGASGLSSRASYREPYYKELSSSRYVAYADKRALLVGINYYGTEDELSGCINDVHNMRRYLLKHGYREDNIMVLADDQKDPVCYPTRYVIMKWMSWLVEGANAGDSLFFHYSGHGSQQTDTDGDEASGKDDTICPVDYKAQGMISDDDMHRLLVAPLPPGCKLTALFDSCHSGTVLDLPYMYRGEDGVLKAYSMWKKHQGEVGRMLKGYLAGNRREVLDGASNIFRQLMSDRARKKEQLQKQSETCAKVISISGCLDSQTSADAQENGVASGVLTSAFLDVVKDHPGASYLMLLRGIRLQLEGRYTQIPQMSSSHVLDMDEEFVP